MNQAQSPEDSNSTRTGSVVFRPRARLIRALGHDLIANEVVAIQELVKNSYDADAHNVTITFEQPLTIGKGVITIADDGDGMNLETIQQAWMEPATSFKVDRTKSREDRRVTGEKGIGRFAAARIAGVLEVTTIPRGAGKRVMVRFEWGVFDDASRYLDEVTCNWEEGPAPPDAPHGTTLKLIGLQDDWESDGTGRRFLALRAALSRLISPLDPPTNFCIQLVVPTQFSRFGGSIEPPAVLARPHYKLSGHVDKEGVIYATYESGRNVEELRDDKAERPTVLLKGGRKPICGPFRFEYRVWDRGSENLENLATELGSTLRDLKRDLDQASGIAIYRDRFRVLLPATDWLRLDLRRVQNPTLRLSNNQVVGMVSISRDQNPQLTDQTNRQGIVDSPALDDFKEAVKDLLSRLEVRRDKAKRALLVPEPQGGLLSQFDLSSVKALVERRYPDDKELLQVLDDRAEAVAKGVGEVKVVLARYRRLATLGQLVDSILHEGRTPLAAISNEIELIKKDLQRASAKDVRSLIADRFQVVRRQSKALSQFFARLSPFSGRKRGRPRTTTMESILGDTMELARRRIDELHVRVSLPDGSTRVTVDEAEMQTIFFNLLDNSLHWLEKVPPEEREIVVQIARDSEALRVTFSDSGPGVPESQRDQIFLPYFSAKPDGVGLGLSLAGETAAEYDGGLELIADGPLHGATFLLTLRTRISGDE